MSVLLFLFWEILYLFCGGLHARRGSGFHGLKVRGGGIPPSRPPMIACLTALQKKISIIFLLQPLCVN